MFATTRRLWKHEGIGFMSRGMQRNLVAVRHAATRRTPHPLWTRAAALVPPPIVAPNPRGVAARVAPRPLAQVAAPIGMTIFLTDTITEYTKGR